MKFPKLPRTTRLAILLTLIILALVIITTDQAPQWIYQGF